MIIMALDHCRDFLHAGAVNGNDPLNFAVTSPFLFLTRWITHFCAPVFVFLAGTSIYFMSLRRSKKELSWFLFTRGAWLMVAELTIVLWGWEGSMKYAFFGLFVIWVLGLSMVCLSVLIFLPRKIIFLLGVVMIFGHNFLDPLNNSIQDNWQGFALSFFHVQHLFVLDSSHKFFVCYPFIPWLGVMLLGYLFGVLYSSSYDAVRRKKILTIMGLAAIALFILLRSGNFYGDFLLWGKQSSTIFTIESFINTSKYPPSLLYLLMTLGPAFLFLAYFENRKSRVTGMISVYGRVPFFYYLIHIYLIHAIAMVVFYATGHHTDELVHGKYFAGLPPGYGLHLWQVYLIWMGVVISLYFPCRWYDRFKQTHKHPLLSYV